MKRILLIITVLLLSLKGISQSMDSISAKIARTEIDKLPSDTIKPFSISGNSVIFPDTLQIPLNTFAQYEIGIDYRNTTTGQILGGNKIVIIQRNGAGVYNVVYDPTPSGNITKTQWTLGIFNGLVLIRLQGQAGATTKGVVSKYLKLISSQ